MRARALRGLVLMAAVLPVFLSIGAPDFNGLERAVSRLFRNTGPDASVTNQQVVRFDASQTPEADAATFELTPRVTDTVAPATRPVLTADLQTPRVERPPPAAGPPREIKHSHRIVRMNGTAMGAHRHACAEHTARLELQSADVGREHRAVVKARALERVAPRLAFAVLISHQ